MHNADGMTITTPNDATPSPNKRWRIPPCPIPILVAIFLGVVIRVAWLDYKPLWEDEAWTFVTAISERPLLETCAADPHPLSFYYVCRQLPAWFLSSDWAFRLPHALASCLALVLIPIVFRQWLSTDSTFARENSANSPQFSVDRGSSAALVRWCVLVFALLPLNVRYAQDARAYAFCQIAGVLVLLVYLRCRQRGTWPAILGLSIATAVSMHIDGFGWITPTVCGLHALLSARHVDARRAIGSLVAGAIAAVPYVYFRTVHMMAAGDMHAVGSGRLGKAFAARWLELSPIGVAFDPVPSKYQFAIWIVAGIAALVFVAGMATNVWREKDDRRWLAVMLFVIPLAGLTLLSLLSGEIYIFKKYLIPTAPAVVLLFTLGFFRLTRGSFVAAVLVLLIVPLGVSAVSNVREGDRVDWRSLYAQMRSQFEPGDLLTQQMHLNYPEYSFGPLRAYAWRDGIDLDASRLYEYTVAHDAAGSIEEVAKARNSNRIWTVTTHWMAKNRMADLSAFADKVVEFDARGCRATLWTIRQDGKP
ncbi:MAG: hypothetical protein H6819_03215 [Phycisphaerales bacterium]|nr:hypothetical protein [Phycisphaerales bacterium]MCB9856206.1 hypothetical protein [Phycisphaerales bacterium]MCB9863355.1 hypothetical protein [Phycisphaerales bacterium]